MSAFTSKTFWADAAERAVKTVAQTALSLLTINSIPNLMAFDWKGFVSAIFLAGVISLLTSIVSAGKTESASLVVK